MLSLSDPSAECQAIWQPDQICRTDTDLSKRPGFTLRESFSRLPQEGHAESCRQAKVQKSIKKDRQLIDLVRDNRNAEQIEVAWVIVERARNFIIAVA